MSDNYSRQRASRLLLQASIASIARAASSVPSNDSAAPASRAHANCFVHQNAMASLGRHGDRTGGCF